MDLLFHALGQVTGSRVRGETRLLAQRENMDTIVSAEQLWAPPMEGRQGRMDSTFADSLKSLRVARGLSQQQLATKLFVDRSTVARWESGDRMPDLAIVPRIAQCLDVDTATLLSVMQEGGEPEIIIVDDERIALRGWAFAL